MLSEVFKLPSCLLKLELVERLCHVLFWPCWTCVFEDLNWIIQFCKLYCMTWLSESLQTAKAASSLFQAWLEKPALAHSNIHGNATAIWSQHAWKCGPLRGAWKWSLMRALTDDVQSSWETHDSSWDVPEASPHLRLRFSPQLLGEPQCTYGGIPDTTLKQQATKQQRPDGRSCLIKEQAGQRLPSRFLIPSALWECRPRLYSRYKAEHMRHSQSVHHFSASMTAVLEVKSKSSQEHSRELLYLEKNPTFSLKNAALLKSDHLWNIIVLKMHSLITHLPVQIPLGSTLISNDSASHDPGL